MVKIKLYLYLSTIITAFSSASFVFAEASWEPLFNGKDLSGWRATDPSKFKVEDGLLIGFQNDGKGADLRTVDKIVNEVASSAENNEVPEPSDQLSENQLKDLDPPSGTGLRFDEIEEMIDEILSYESN